MDQHRRICGFVAVAINGWLIKIFIADMIEDAVCAFKAAIFYPNEGQTPNVDQMKTSCVLTSSQKRSSFTLLSILSTNEHHARMMVQKIAFVTLAHACEIAPIDFNAHGGESRNSHAALR